MERHGEEIPVSRQPSSSIDHPERGHPSLPCEEPLTGCITTVESLREAESSSAAIGGSLGLEELMEFANEKIFRLLYFLITFMIQYKRLFQ